MIPVSRCLACPFSKREPKLISPPAGLSSAGLARTFRLRSFTKDQGSEADLDGGKRWSCFTDHTCLAEADYYDEPTLATFRKDVIKLRFEVSKTYGLDDGASVGWYAGADYYGFFHYRNTATFRFGATDKLPIEGPWSFKSAEGVSFDVAAGTVNVVANASIDLDLGKGWSWSPICVEGFKTINIANGAAPFDSKSMIVAGMHLAYNW